MSYARFGSDNSDVYIYEHVGGFIECCGCLLHEPETDNELDIFGFYHANTAREILAHIEEHRAAGHNVPDRCVERIKEDHPDLDAQIPPFEYTPEQKARHAEMFKRWKAEYDAERGE